MKKEKKEKNLNYNFEKGENPYQKHPKKPMGQGDFANMPREAQFLKFKCRPDYRGGIVNSFSADVEEVSEIYENQRED